MSREFYIRAKYTELVGRYLDLITEKLHDRLQANIEPKSVYIYIPFIDYTIS